MIFLKVFTNKIKMKLILIYQEDTLKWANIFDAKMQSCQKQNNSIVFTTVTLYLVCNYFVA